MLTPLSGAATAILLGMLLGLERERSHHGEPELFAGIRTFPMLTLGGYLAAATGERLVLVAFLLAVGGLAIAAYVRDADHQAGATTEVVAVFAPLLGALVQNGQSILASSAAVVVTLLLTLKAPLHRLAGSVTEEEILSILKFGIVAVVLLPLLPTEAIGPYKAIVPRHVGYVVVVLSGVSLTGYLLVRFLGTRSGWALAGLLGGIVSSGAVTLSFAGKAREMPALVRALAVGILLASTILYVRSLLLIGVFDGALAVYLAPRLLGLFVVGLAFAALNHRKSAGEESTGLGLGNPVELGRAFVLALLFAGILLAARAAQVELGTAGLWSTAALGGLMDVDAVAVAIARLRQQGLAPMDAAGGAYLLATLSNLLMKAGLVVVVGGAPLARRVLPGFAMLGAATAALIFF
jgi:uncharacterized membrane protein (DUF4010 family)